jgi:K+-sensing histidine kinase KdpD
MASGPDDSRSVVQSSCWPLLRSAGSNTYLSALLRYGSAVASPAIVMGVRLLLDPLLGDHLPFAPFLIAVVFTSWVGGWKPALLTFSVSLLIATYIFTPPRWSFRIDLVEHQVELVLYFFIGITTILLFESVRKARQRAEQALANIKQLQGLLPICAWCKKIRDDRNYWHQVESYLAEHTGTHFTHGICPTCFEDMNRSVAQQKHA